MRVSVAKSQVVVILFVIIGSYFLQGIIPGLGLPLASMIKLSMPFIIVSYIFLFAVSTKLTMDISFFRILLVLSFVFYYGQHCLVLVDSSFLQTTSYYTILKCRVEDEYIIKATFLIIRLMALLYLGYVFGRSRSKTKNNIEKRREQKLSVIRDDKKYIRIVFGGIFIISAIAAFTIAIYRMRLQAVMGYSELRENDYTVYLNAGLIIYFFSLIYHFFLPSTYMLLLLEKGKKQKLVLAVLLCYCFLYVLSGSRYTILKVLVILVLIRYVWMGKFNLKGLFKMGTIVILVALSFSVISLIRNTGINTETFFEVAKNQAAATPIASILWETGITFHSISTILQHCPSDVPFAYGVSLLGAILCCLPNFLRFGFFEKHNMVIGKIFSPFFYHTTEVGYGSSFIAEAYFCFGYLLPVVVLVYGYILGRLEERAYYAAENKKYYSFFMIVFLFGEFSYGIRTDLYGIPRTFLLYAFIPVLLCKFFSKIMRRKV